jgi:1-acyl-sn-glycerol-3-phosphate acyltransferase
MKRLFRTFFALYGAIVFAISLILVFPGYYIIFSTMGKKAPEKAHKFSQTWAYCVFFLLFMRLKIKGKELINPNQTYVFVGNHQSLLDIPLFAIACKNTIRFLAKEELTKIPVMGYVIRKIYVSVKRSDKANRKKSLIALMSSLKEHISIFLCPEGTRNKTDQPLLDFKDGAFLLAIEAQVPLAFITVMNTKELLPPTRLDQLSPGTLHGIWNEPISTIGLTEQDIPMLKQKVREGMLANIAHFKKYGHF